MTETVSRSESADGHAHSLLVEHQPLILAEGLCDHQRREEGGHQKGDDPGNARGKLASPYHYRAESFDRRLPLWHVARSAAELLTSQKFGRVKVRAGEGCGWMFLDESRNGSRRWCDSRDCGNRERVRRHLARKRASRS